MRNRIFERSNRKTLFLLLTLALCFSITLTSYGQTIVSVQPAATLEIPEVGEQLTVNVAITGGKVVAGYQVTVGFDPTALRYLSATDAGYFPSGAYTVPLQGDQDITVVAAALKGTATESHGILATLTFEVLDPKPTGIHLTDVILSDATATAMAVRWTDGQNTWNDVTRIAPPEQTAMLPNYPNPFNPETWIPYQLAAAADVSLAIHSADGTLVRTLSLGHQAAGIYQSKSRAAYWDGRNALGEHVASGLYFYTFTAGDFSATGKMLILK